MDNLVLSNSGLWCNKCVLAIGRYESGEARNEGKPQYF